MPHAIGSNYMLHWFKIGKNFLFQYSMNSKQGSTTQQILIHCYQHEIFIMDMVHYVTKRIWTPYHYMCLLKIPPLLLLQPLFFWEGCQLDCTGDCGNFSPFCHKSISEVRKWCRLGKPGPQSVFHFFPKGFNGIEMSTLPIVFGHCVSLLCLVITNYSMLIAPLCCT